MVKTGSRATTSQVPMIEPRCTACSKPYPSEGVPFRCPECGGLFDYPDPPRFDQNLVNSSLPGIWRYAHALGLPESGPRISIGEGNTPLVRRSCFGREISFKLEFLNPTGSFKDRGSAVLASLLIGRDASQAIEDSSGNAGASFAAYAAAGGLAAQIFVPDTASGPKLAQMEAYGARVVRVPGGRERTSAVTLEALGGRAVYASHAYLPHNLLGYATLAYEVYSQLGSAPGTLVVPAGQGGLLLGVSRGFEALHQSGYIQHIPALVGVQARRCAPLFAAFRAQNEEDIRTDEGETVAEGIRVRQPVRKMAVLNAVRSSHGSLLAVGEPEILAGRGELARLGFYVEPTSAVVWNALEQSRDRLVDPVVVILTGSGLKSA